MSFETARRVIDPAKWVPAEEATAWLSGRIAGTPPVVGLSGEHGILARETIVFEGADVWLAPRFGAISDRAGEFAPESVAEARFFSSDLSAVPRPSGSERSIDSASVFMPWGAADNFGHFLVDALGGAEAMRLAGVDYPLIAPPLRAYQRDLLAMAGFHAQEIPDDVVSLRCAAWTNALDHYLHWPNATLLSLSARMQRDLRQSGPRLAYISRTRVKNDKRRLLNEAEVERALARLGFIVVHPQELSVREQAEVFHSADVIAGATGAALASAIFMRPGAALIEICPTNFVGIWSRNICRLMGVDWFVHYFPASSESWLFDYRVDAPAFAKFVASIVHDRRSAAAPTIAGEGNASLMR